MTTEQLRAALTVRQFPLSSKYDLEWLCENEMGPTSAWLTEFLIRDMNIQPGMRILDMGCGRAVSSIFLAKELGVTVFANDLWIDPTDNWKRIEEAGLTGRVFPIRAEAHALPYAKGFFDAIVSLDAYHYFGTDDMFLSSFAQYLKTGGEIGIVVPGVVKEFDGRIPERLKPYWEPYLFTHHSPEWWRKHFENSGSVEVVLADAMPNGYELWLKWDKTLKDAGRLKRSGDVDMLVADGGNFTFTRVIARKRSQRMFGNA
ncbi:MAG TPA: methyltransferase domain-containing protein [Clostridia bacterium]|nr:methyltransferase domain-containing protein [Clostridia bacterium]